MLKISYMRHLARLKTRVLNYLYVVSLVLDALCREEMGGIPPPLVGKKWAMKARNALGETGGNLLLLGRREWGGTTGPRSYDVPLQPPHVTGSDTFNTHNSPGSRRHCSVTVPIARPYVRVILLRPVGKIEVVVNLHQQWRLGLRLSNFRYTCRVSDHVAGHVTHVERVIRGPGGAERCAGRARIWHPSPAAVHLYAPRNLERLRDKPKGGGEARLPRKIGVDLNYRSGQFEFGMANSSVGPNVLPFAWQWRSDVEVYSHVKVVVDSCC